MKDYEQERKELKERFYVLSQKFFDSGILKEIYQGESFSVCNILNMGYWLFDFYAVSDKKNDPYGIFFAKDTIIKIIEDPAYYYTYLLPNVPDEYLKKTSFFLDENSFEVLESNKDYLMKSKPNVNIDFDWEERLRNKNNSKGL